MPLSVTALADDNLRKQLITAARESGHRLLLPRGALVGMDSLFSWRHMWREVTITFRKHPRNLDLARTGRNRRQHHRPRPFCMTARFAGLLPTTRATSTPWSPARSRPSASTDAAPG